MKTAIFIALLVVALVIGYKANSYYRSTDRNVQFMEAQAQDKINAEKSAEDVAAGNIGATSANKLAKSLRNKASFPSMLIRPTPQTNFTRQRVSLEDSTNSNWWRKDESPKR